MPRRRDQRAPLFPRLAAILIPLLAMTVLLGWTVASPVGASPDDDYHMTSIWCAGEGRSSLCVPASDPLTRDVPEVFSDEPCFARFEEVSASCQFEGIREIDFVETDRGNFRGQYPPVFYGAMSLMASDDIEASIIAMRAVNSLLFVTLLTVIALALPARDRWPIVLTGLVTLVPLGVFLVASVNPSSWTITGVMAAWFATLGWMRESRPGRMWMLGSTATIGVVMASGARADGAVYAAFAVVIAVLVSLRREPGMVARIALPVALLIITAISILTTRQLGTAAQGFTNKPDESVAETLVPVPVPGSDAVVDPSMNDWLSAAVANTLQLPALWAGVFGSWPLGWLDTPMPAIVSVGSGAVFLVAVFIGFSAMGWRKALALIAVVGALWFIPVWTLTQGGHSVGEQVQPRYILPLIILAAAFSFIPHATRTIVLSRAQAVVIAAVLAITLPTALFITMRRFVTGLDEDGANLSAGAEWWWGSAIGPTAAWLLVSLAWWALLALLLLIHRGTPSAAADHPTTSLLVDAAKGSTHQRIEAPETAAEGHPHS